MFAPEDFQVPLEADLKLRIMYDEIDNCSDVEALRKHLKETAKLVMIYQQMLGSIAKDMITKDLTNWAEEFKKGKS